MSEQREDADILSMLCELGERASSLDNNVAAQMNSLAVLAFAVRARDVRDIESALAVCHASMLASRLVLAGVRSVHLEFLRRFLSEETCTAIPDVSAGPTPLATGELFARGSEGPVRPTVRPDDVDLMPG